MNSGIYIIKNKVNNKIYVGSSSDINRRWCVHKSKLRNNKHDNIHLQRSWNEYGKDNFEFSIIEYCNTNLKELEEKYIHEMKSYDFTIGFNMSEKAYGGDNISNHPNKDLIIEKIKKSLKERFDNMTELERQELSNKMIGEKNPNFNHRWTDEMKENNSIKLIEYFETHESYQTGKSWEELFGEEKAKELRENLSKVASSRTGDKNPFYGVHHSEHSKDKIRQKRLGKYHGHQNLPFEIDGKKYNSLGEASKLLNIPIPTVRWRIKSKAFPNYNYI